MTRGWLALVAGLSLGCPSCVGYVRFQVEEAVPEALVAGFANGQGLGDCLQRLGAPNHVYEYRVDGAAMLWAWSDADDWSADLRVPLQEHFSASFELDVTDTEAQGLMLWFGPDLRLERWRRGRLGDLLPARVRPAAVDDDA